MSLNPRMPNHQYPGCTENENPTVPILPRFILKDVVTELDPLQGHGVEFSARILCGDPLQSVEDGALPVRSHVLVRPPEDIRRVSRLSKVAVPVFEQAWHAGVRDHTHARAATHVGLVAHRGRIVHADHARNSVDVGAQARVAHLSGTGDQGALVEVQVQELEQKNKQTRSYIVKRSLKTSIMAPLDYVGLF